MTRTFKESSLAGLNMAFYLDANGEGHLVMVILDGNGRIISTGRSNVEARFVDTKGFNVVEGNDYEAARVEYGSDFLLKGKRELTLAGSSEVESASGGRCVERHTGYVTGILLSDLFLPQAGSLQIIRCRPHDIQ